MEKDFLIYFDLLTSLKTVEDVNELSLELDNFTSDLFNSEKMTYENILSSVRESTAKKIMEMFSKNNLDLNNKEAVRDFLDALIDLIKKLKIIKLILAYEPSLKTIEKIHSFVFENIGPGYILDIEVSESIMAGAIVMFNGKYKDFSLKKTLEETFLKKREEILQGMSS